MGHVLRNGTLIDRVKAVVGRWRVELLRDGPGVRRPRPALFLVAALLLLALGAVDYVTGPEIGSSVFYLLPVSLVAAYAHWRVAALFAVAAAAVWLVADLTSGATYSHVLIPYWNALIRLGFFLIVAFLLGALRNSYEALSDIHQELQRLAVFEDRERIAQELHDGVIQSLFGVGLTIQAAAAAGDQRVLRPELEHVLDEIDRVIRDVRSYIFALRPRLLTHHEFERAFRDLVEGFGQTDRVSLEVAIEPETASRLGPRSGDLLQSAREALSNAVRHSVGDRVTLNVKQTASALVLEVEDNGMGFDPHEEAGKGQGLSNLYARAQALGGRLDIETAPGLGSRVRLLVPL